MYPDPQPWGIPTPIPNLASNNEQTIKSLYTLSIAPNDKTKSYDVGVPHDSTSPHSQIEQLFTPDDKPITYKKPNDTEHEIQLVHDAHHKGGHFGTRAIHAALHREGWRWPKMARNISKVCNDCLTCQQWNRSKRIFHPITPATSICPWDMIQIDISTSMDPAPTGEKYILVITDVFSSFCLLRPLFNKSAKDVADALYQIFNDFGPPRFIQGDNDGAFC